MKQGRTAMMFITKSLHPIQSLAQTEFTITAMSNATTVYGVETKLYAYRATHHTS
jgi:calcineurin-like phosphoesterase